jgi:lysyl-tRNA synthetase class 2
VDDEHLPEHIAMESYAAFQDYREGMDFYEEMIKSVAEKTWGTTKFVFAKNPAGAKKMAEIREKLSDEKLSGDPAQDFADMMEKISEKTADDEDFALVDLSGKWPRKAYSDLLQEKFGVDAFMTDSEENREILRKILRENKREFDENASVARLLDYCWKIIREESAGPYWLIHEPVSVSPLAKKHAENPAITERFHPVIFGTEMGNGFSELNDPLDQLSRFLEQQKMRDAGDKEAMMLDIDFVEMLEYGMPPTCGWGNSERNFWLFEGVSAREGVPFPAMKSEVSEVSKKIYPDVKFDLPEKNSRKSADEKLREKSGEGK